MSDSKSEIRLGDKILSALEMALEQNDLNVAETLLRALEMTMTRKIGEGFVERRDYPEALEKAMVKLEELRKINGVED